MEEQLIEAIITASKRLERQITLMEVCGTHTMSIFRHGIKSMLPGNIRLISGPGCPVCVTPPQYIDQAIQLAGNNEVIICSFGDMLRVPGIEGTLENTRMYGADIRIVYSPLDCIRIAKDNPGKMVVFLAVGFETTSPVVGLCMKQAEDEGADNFLILPGLKLLFPALKSLFNSGEVKVDGLICPGHVTSVTGQAPYEFIPEMYGIPCVIAGFELTDILMSIYMLILQVVDGRACVENAYKRAGTEEGNARALRVIEQVFQKSDVSWRGLGIIPQSGLEPSKDYNHRNARTYYKLERPVWTGDGACSCGDVIKGLKTPFECPLFRNVCTPQSPIGACMVSSEGSCAAYYKYSC